jgi:hypothetical protein
LIDCVLFHMAGALMFWERAEEFNETLDAFLSPIR